MIISTAAVVSVRWRTSSSLMHLQRFRGWTLYGSHHKLTKENWTLSKSMMIRRWAFFLVLRSDRRIGNACQIPNGMIDRLPFWVIYDTAMNNAICDKIYINYMSKSQMHPRILTNDHCHGNGTVATDRTRGWYHNKRMPLPTTNRLKVSRKCLNVSNGILHRLKIHYER